MLHLRNVAIWSPMVYLGDRSADAMLGGARMAAQILDDFLNEQLEKSKLTPDRLALIGFSQDYDVSIRWTSSPEQIAGIVGYSAFACGRSAEKRINIPPVT